MDEDTRGRIQQHLTERAEGDWHDLSVVEKKAGESGSLSSFCSLVLLQPNGLLPPSPAASSLLGLALTRASPLSFFPQRGTFRMDRGDLEHL